ncbi:MAG TPA: DNA polymerase III subunit gamma/tau [Gemmatimonadales bacterium]|nr:DNA polymerase III subunit gamma/tau [Gemmatimonadales bacterium]
MIALARKYRPRRFADLLVQDHVAMALRGAVARGRVGHGYLLTGPRGTGKTTAARILAMALNCERRSGASAEGEPCGACPSCDRIWSGSATLDVVEIDAASNRGVDDARDLRERAMYAASQEGRHKVYIIDEAHMLTREAWNALLKILEEPPPGVIFVFATTEPQKIASTAAPVLSRLQRFDFRRIGPAAIRNRLRQVLGLEQLAADDDALALIARYADGGMRDALSVLDQCLSFGEGPVTAPGVRQVLGLIDHEQYAAILRAIAARDTGAVFPIVDGLVNAGADLAEFMTGAADLLRAVLMAHSGIEPEGLTEVQRQVIAEVRGRLAPADIVRMLGALSEAEASIRRSGSSRLIVETLLLRWTVMDRIVDLEQVISGAGGGRMGIPAAKPAASPSPTRAPATPPAGLLPEWPAVVSAARERSMLLGEVLDQTTPELIGDRLELRVAPGHEVLAEGLVRQLATIEELVAQRFGSAIRVRVRAEAISPTSPLAAVPPNVLVDRDLQAKELGRLRGLDPALDAAADELDLEIVDDKNISPPRSPRS